MGLSWQGSEYSLVLLPPGIFVNDPPNLPEGAITQENYQNSAFDIDFINGFESSGKPYKFFQVNNPGIGAWTYAIIENESPPADSTEPIRVYSANEMDLILEFKSDRERYFLQFDQDGNAIPILVNLEAKLFEGGESAGFSGHTITGGEPVDDALVSVKIDAPDGQTVLGRLIPSGGGIYTISLETILLGNYDISVIASDNVISDTLYNSQYLITTEHSFFVSLFEEPQEITGELYIQWALDILKQIMLDFCPNPPQNCSLTNKDKRDINNAIGYIETALGYFEDDGNHLKTNKGLKYYDKITRAVNKIYALISNTEFGDKIENAIFYLKEGSFKIAVIARDEAEEEGACVVSNCEELLKNANKELGKALREYEKENYVNTFNHLTNAWKHAQNMIGSNLRKETAGNNNSLPTEYGLDQNYPNPFNPSTEIRYQLPENSRVKLQVFDILGNLVTTLVDQQMQAGYHSVVWNANRFASGVYFYTLRSGPYVSTKKLMLLK